MEESIYLYWNCVDDSDNPTNKSDAQWSICTKKLIKNIEMILSILCALKNKFEVKIMFIVHQ